MVRVSSDAAIWGKATDAPHTPGGCFFQAWSVAELLRIETQVLGELRDTPPERSANDRALPAPALNRVGEAMTPGCAR